MNKEIISEQMIEYILKIEKENRNEKFVSDNNIKKNVVTSILAELERLTNDED